MTGLLGGQRAIDVCRTAEGRVKVYGLAQALADGVFPLWIYPKTQ